MKRTIWISALFVMILAAACSGGSPSATAEPEEPTSPPEATPEPDGSPAIVAPSPTPDPSGSDAGTPTPPPTPTERPSTPVPDVNPVLEEISAAMSDAGSWRMEALVTVGSSESQQPAATVQISAARSAEENYVMVTNTTVSEGGSPSNTPGELRVIDGVQYVLDGSTGQWSSSEATGARPELAVDAAVTESVDTETAEAEIVEMDGEQVYHVTGEAPGDGVDSVELWAGVEDGLLRQMQLSGSAASSNFSRVLPELEGDNTQQVQAIYRAVGEPVTVNSPDLEPQEVEGTDGMVRYRSPIYPFSIARPADWTPEPRQNLSLTAWSASSTVLLVTEEPLEGSGLLEEGAAGDELLTSYVDRVVSGLEQQLQGFEVVAREPYEGLPGENARVLEFTGEAGDGEQLRWRRLVYVHEDRLAFGATYGGNADQFQEITDIIDTSFSSFEVIE